MDYTTLGKTGLKVSVAGLGCGGNSRIGQGSGKSEDESVALIRRALGPRRQPSRHRRELSRPKGSSERPLRRCRAIPLW